MRAVKSIDKTMTVGTGQSSYKGVPDDMVKEKIGEAMQENGLCLLPISVEDETRIDRWEETNGAYTKQKQSVFVSVKTKYLLLHESGESIELSGYGHGVDSQDKAAGKATTYALKYALLYSFLVPTKKIDDSDRHHSDDTQAAPPKKVVFTQSHFDKMRKAIEGGNAQKVKDSLHLYNISEEFKSELDKLLK